MRPVKAEKWGLAAVAAPVVLEYLRGEGVELAAGDIIALAELHPFFSGERDTAPRAKDDFFRGGESGALDPDGYGSRQIFGQVPHLDTSATSHLLTSSQDSSFG